MLSAGVRLEERILEYFQKRAEGNHSDVTAISVVDDLGLRRHVLGKVKYRLNKLVKAGDLEKRVTHRWDQEWTGSQSFFGGYVSCKRLVAYYQLKTAPLLKCPARANYQDPESHNRFIFHTRVNVRVNVDSDGDQQGIEYIDEVQLNEDEDMECCECGWYGPVREFKGGK